MEYPQWRPVWKASLAQLSNALDVVSPTDKPAASMEEMRAFGLLLFQVRDALAMRQLVESSPEIAAAFHYIATVTDADFETDESARAFRVTPHPKGGEFHVFASLMLQMLDAAAEEQDGE